MASCTAVLTLILYTLRLLACLELTSCYTTGYKYGRYDRIGAFIYNCESQLVNAKAFANNQLSENLRYG